MVWGYQGNRSTTLPLKDSEKYMNLKEYYAAHPELAAKYNNNVHHYTHDMLMKLYLEPGTRYDRESDPIAPPEDHEWPTDFRTTWPTPTYAKIKSLLDMYGGGGILVVDQALKDLIESLEPGVHTFRPVKLTTWDAEEFPGQHFILLIGQFIESFSPQDSDPEAFQSEFSTLNNRNRYSSMGGKERCARLAFSRTAFGGAHLWRERCLRSPNVFFSNELRAAISKAGLKIPPLYRMKEVA
ncbi:MAG: hypothetical protein HC844_04830 [Tabrizicola sp.]|nr:hypothetical protein [Tabrizicola sp.]